MPNSFTTLIDTKTLDNCLGEERVVVLDCRFDLADRNAGRRAYLEAHIDGARYVDLESDLSGAPATDRGRHPLPPVERIEAVFEQFGIDAGSQVVAYDAQNGMVAARAWWMLRYIGHFQVALLDGGWQAWCDYGGACASGEQFGEPGVLRANPRTDRLVRYSELDGQQRLIDAREGGRYRGEYEPIDKLAGHIPGAENYHFALNIGPDGLFLKPDEIRRRWSETLGKLPDDQTVHYCGSGVSACHNIFSQVYAGLPEPRLYCGSWSEWSRINAKDNDTNE